MTSALPKSSLLGQKKSPTSWWGVNENLAATYSPTLLCAVPLAMKVLTSEFGMGSGVSPSLMPPRKIVLAYRKLESFSDSLVFTYKKRRLKKLYLAFESAQIAALLHSNLATSSAFTAHCVIKVVKPMDILVLVS